MSKQRSLDGISDTDRRVFRLFKVLASEGRHALQFVFKWGCKKDPKETLEQYLTNKKHMTNKDYQKKFNTNMQNEIINDHSCESFDVSLTFACIRWACDHLATDPEEWREGKGNLESLCTKVKNMRNNICHGEEMQDDAAMHDRCKDITEVLEKVIKETGRRFGIPDDEIQKRLKKINEQVSAIMKAPLGDFDLHHIQKFREEQKKTIKDIGKNELSEHYKDMSKIDPASFVTGKERLDVKSVFTKLEVVCENMNETYEVEYKDLLEVKTETASEPAVIIVEGDAGAGKTTLTKLMLLDWAEGSTIFEGLGQYDLVFRAEGKRHVSSYLELILGLMPTVSYKFDDKDLVRSANQLKVLLIMDGFDELNKESEKLIRELRDEHIPASSGKLQLLITTRPSKISDLFAMLGTHTKIQAKLRGISSEKRVEFVINLHNEMVKEGQSSQDTQRLVEFLKMSQARLGEHYRLPLNLTLLTYLWASDPSKVNLETTSTGLYIALQMMIESRLQARLQERLGCVALPSDKSQEVVSEFQEKLYEVCLDTLIADSMQLSDKSEKTLKQKCEELDKLNKLNVPFFFNEMTEAFLVVEKEWTSSGYKTELTVPHKSILEFYAAHHILTHVKTSDDVPEVDELLAKLMKMKLGKGKDEILQFLKKPPKEDENPEDKKPLANICKELKITDKDWEKCENMFLHLTGLLAHQCPDVAAKYYEEIVHMLRDTFTNRGTRWLDLLVEGECADELARLLAPVYDLQLIIRDGHMTAALAMFKHLEANTPVQVIVENDMAYIPRFDEMISELSNRGCSVQIAFKHQWKNLEYSDDRLNSLLSAVDDNQRCTLTTFTGHLTTLSCLPESTTELKIALATTEHAKQLVSELTDLVERNENISYIGVHVAPEVMPDGLSPLPVLVPRRGECGFLWLSGVGENWKTRCKVIRALLPDKGKFNSIKLPRSNLTYNQCSMMLSCMKDLKINVGRTGGIWFSSTSIDKEQLRDLKNAAKQYFDCALYCSDESSMW